MLFLFFFFNDTATTEIYTLSLHDALPILIRAQIAARAIFAADDLDARIRELDYRIDAHAQTGLRIQVRTLVERATRWLRSEEHTSELQSRQYLVCRLLLEKKKTRLKQKEQ